MLAAASPAYGDGRIFVVAALARQERRRAASSPRCARDDGKILWKRAPPVAHGVLAAVRQRPSTSAPRAGRVYAVSARDGATRWTLQGRRRGQGPRSRWPTATLYFGDYGGRVYARPPARDGRQVWRTGTNGAHFGLRLRALLLDARGRLRPRLHRQHRRRDVLVRRDSGKLAWSKGTGAYVYASPAVAQVPGGQPTVYFGSYDGNFYALDARSGATSLELSLGRASISGAPTIVGDIVYFSDSGMTDTTALDALSGRKVWVFHKGAFNPVISDGRTIFLTGHTSLYAMRPKGIKARAALKPTTAREAPAAPARAPAQGGAGQAGRGAQEAQRQEGLSRCDSGRSQDVMRARSGSAACRSRGPTARASRATARDAVIERALDRGATLLDTAEAYGLGETSASSAARSPAAATTRCWPRSAA